MDVDDFRFELPDELVAQHAAPRGASRLLVLARDSGAIRHAHMFDLPVLLRAGDLLVVNNTRVFAARLLGHRVPSGGAVECLLLEPPAATLREPQGSPEPGRRARRPPPAASRDERVALALMHPGQKLKPGAVVR
jgi:S-adenosylmethionine:tRNA-ribosyltransferase-isomerase (queuine synthetase)